MHQKADRLDGTLTTAAYGELFRVTVAEKAGEVEVRYGERRWLFPREDCVLLPLANTTAELLGRYIGLRLLDVLRRETGYEPRTLRVEVEESFGQAATYEWAGG